MILRERVPNKMPPAGVAAVLLLALVVVPAWSIGQESSEEPAAAPAATPAPGAPTVAIPAPREVKLEFTSEAPLIPTIVPGIVEYQVSQAPPAAAAVPAPVVVAQPAPQPADDAQRRLQALEAQIAQLQAEIKALRGGSASTSTGSVGMTAPVLNLKAATPPTARQLTVQAYPAARHSYQVSAKPRSFELQTLSRGTYKLPQPKAEALAAFLREHGYVAPGAVPRSAGEDANDPFGTPYVDKVAPAGEGEPARPR
jgi:hypothetical protein